MSTVLKPNLDLVLFRTRRFVQSCSDQERQMMVMLLDPAQRPYSLRLIEYFLTRYIKEIDSEDVQIDTVSESYRRVLSSYSKETFDCFARGNDTYPIEINDAVYFSVPAQLNFFRWFVVENIHPVLMNHMRDASERMKAERLKQRKKSQTLKAQQQQYLQLQQEGEGEAEEIEGEEEDDYC